MGWWIRSFRVKLCNWFAWHSFYPSTFEDWEENGFNFRCKHCGMGSADGYLVCEPFPKRCLRNFRKWKILQGKTIFLTRDGDGNRSGEGSGNAMSKEDFYSHDLFVGCEFIVSKDFGNVLDFTIVRSGTPAPLIADCIFNYCRIRKEYDD